VIISDELIGSPVITNPDVLILMSDASLNKFQPRLKQNGLLIFDSSLIRDPVLRADIEIVRVPATDISSKIGNTKSANMVLLGAVIAKTKLLKETSVLEALESSMPGRKKKTIEVNKKAIIEGIRYIEDKKG
jgi:2-oxoglutarate ferredoxin oxidoreductase subunit gamma